MIGLVSLVLVVGTIKVRVLNSMPAVRDIRVLTYIKKSVHWTEKK
jgi:hypothetical protein